jgi:predicted metalloendopeptidase
LYNPVTIAQLEIKYPFINWLDFINSKLLAGLKFDENEVVILQQPTYYDRLEEILNQTDTRTIANHIIWRELSDYIAYLTSDLREMEFEFYKIFSGRSVKQARWSECIKGVSGMLNIAVSSMYVREHFRDERIRKDISNIISEISSEFEKLLHANNWMDVATKAEGMKKLQSMSSHIAYPEELLNDTIVEDFYKNLVFNTSNYLQSAIEVDTHSKTFLCSRYHEPVKRNDWVDHASSIYVNANYHGKSNSIREWQLFNANNKIFNFSFYV